MALAIIAAEWAKKNGGKITALTVDHGIRKEAANEAKQVKKWLSAKKIEHFTLTYKGQKPKANIQDEARKIRYNLMLEWCRDNGVIHLLVAHHAQDQAETFLLRVERGSGVDGLAAMAKISSRNGIRILRPLLDIKPEEIRKYLKNIGQNWIEDPTNQNMHYKRNKIRKTLDSLKTINHQPSTINHICETAENMARARIALEEITAQKMVECVDIFPAGYCLIKPEEFLSLTEEIALRILSATLATISGNEYKPRFEDLLRLMAAIKNSGFSGATLWGCRIYSIKNKMMGGVIAVTRELNSVSPGIMVNPQESLMWDSRFMVKTNSKLLVAALGKEIATRLLKEHPELFKLNMPKPVLYTLPAFFAINHKTSTINSIENLVSIPHIGYVGKSSKKIETNCIFRPAKPLAGAAFGCYAQG